MGTHQELEMFGSQPAYPEKLLHKKESLQNQLINIRVELSQASTVTEDSYSCIFLRTHQKSWTIVWEGGQIDIQMYLSPY